MGRAARPGDARRTGRHTGVPRVPTQPRAAARPGAQLAVRAGGLAAATSVRQRTASTLGNSAFTATTLACTRTLTATAAAD